jgi:hypothetical protein
MFRYGSYSLLFHIFYFLNCCCLSEPLLLPGVFVGVELLWDLVASFFLVHCVVDVGVGADVEDDSVADDDVDDEVDTTTTAGAGTGTTG